MISGIMMGSTDKSVLISEAASIQKSSGFDMETVVPAKIAGTQFKFDVSTSVVPANMADTGFKVETHTSVSGVDILAKYSGIDGIEGAIIEGTETATMGIVESWLSITISGVLHSGTSITPMAKSFDLSLTNEI